MDPHLFVLWFLKKLPLQAQTVLQTCAYGVGAGLAAVAFQLGISFVYDHTFKALAHQSTPIFLMGTLAVLLSSSLLTGFLLSSVCPEAAGSGIPQLKLAYWKDFGFVPWRAVWVKFLAGLISIGGGNSLGREGPSVHLAGGLGSNLAGWLGKAKQSRRRGAAAGAAAGLAAAFNTPLASITFVLEEIIEDLNSRVLGSVLLASVIGALVVHGLIGKHPAFTLHNVESPGWKAFLLVPLIAAVGASVGMLFQKVTLQLRAGRKYLAGIPAFCRPALGGIITWALGAAVFLATGHLGVFSLGYDDLSAGLENGLSWKLGGLLLITKLIATIACYGFGGCGGIFSPTLFFGCMCGVTLSGVCGMVVPLSPADHVALAVIGMSSCLGAVVRAPVTSILIVFEMTHEFALVPALMLGALVSQAVARRLAHHNFYEAILVQDGHFLKHVIPPRDLQSWQQLPVSAIANFKPVAIHDWQPEPVRKFLQDHPYERFPFFVNRKLAGIVQRQEAEMALVENRLPKVESAPTCQPAQTIQELQAKWIESPSHIILLVEEEKLLGLVTLHDLLRAEIAFATGSKE